MDAGPSPTPNFNGATNGALPRSVYATDVNLAVATVPIHNSGPVSVWFRLSKVRFQSL